MMLDIYVKVMESYNHILCLERVLVVFSNNHSLLYVNFLEIANIL